MIRDNRKKLARVDTVSIVLLMIVAILILSIVYLAYSPKKLVGVDDDIYHLRANTWKAARQAMMDTRESRLIEALDLHDGSLDEMISDLFDIPRSHVEDAADWYYSSWSRIMRTGLTIIRSEVEPYILEELNKRLFPASEWDTATYQLNLQIREHSNNSNQEVMRSATSELLARLDPFRVSGSSLAPDAWVREIQNYEGMYEISITDNALLYQTGFSVATSTVAAATTRAVLQRAAARAASRGATASITPVSAACGPGAWLCAAGIWSVSLGATEFGILKLDEYRNRPELERVLLEDINLMEAEARIMANQILHSAIEGEYEYYSSVVIDQLRPIDAIFAR